MEYIAERPHAWLERQLVMEEVEAEVVNHRDRQREQMSRQR